ncbi:MAG TPA: hypothetical protein PLP29_13165 [Candidatus Ozemobacteraceae bacterium]|nr:hypothetical protein [Candidatus Ozemobacteraceae bacterium]
MEKKVGVWVDHRKAVIVTLTQDQETVHVISSEAETGAHASAGDGPRAQYGAQAMYADDTLQNKSSIHLKKYYNDIVAHLNNADSIMLMGPGEAKLELQRNLVRHMMGGKILDVRPADRMTVREVTLDVRAWYAKS